MQFGGLIIDYDQVYRENKKFQDWLANKQIDWNMLNQQGKENYYYKFEKTGRVIGFSALFTKPPVQTGVDPRGRRLPLTRPKPGKFTLPTLPIQPKPMSEQDMLSFFNHLENELNQIEAALSTNVSLAGTKVNQLKSLVGEMRNKYYRSRGRLIGRGRQRGGRKTRCQGTTSQGKRCRNKIYQDYCGHHQ